MNGNTFLKRQEIQNPILSRAKTPRRKERLGLVFKIIALLIFLPL